MLHLSIHVNNIVFYIFYNFYYDKDNNLFIFKYYNRKISKVIFQLMGDIKKDN